MRKWALIVVLMLVGTGAHADNATEVQRALHVLNRIAFGPRPGDLQHVLDIGVERYIAEQLHPERVALPGALDRQLASLDTASRPAGELITAFREAQRTARQNPEQGRRAERSLVARLNEQAATGRLARAVCSPRQLEEVMVDFWFNHFNVFQGKGLTRVLVASYEREAIRPYVFGRFRDLLGATAHHPAMLIYLDNWQSTAAGFKPPGRAQIAESGLNENYARELMELHTLGVNGGYTQKDVTELARMLTGWTIDPRSGSFLFAAARHDRGEKIWLGQRITDGGQAEGEQALDRLARADATARQIAFQLAQYFVADQPPPALVERLARRFEDTDGDIRAVLDTLLHSDEFWDPAYAGRKFKTPYQYVLSMVRAAGVNELNNVRPVLGSLRQLGMPLYGCQTPDGYKNTEDAWLNPDAVSRRISFATALAGGRMPLSKHAPPLRDDDSEAAPTPLTSPGPVAGSQPVPGADELLNTLSALITAPTRAEVASAEPRLRAALILGSPDFMRR